MLKKIIESNLIFIKIQILNSKDSEIYKKIVKKLNKNNNFVFNVNFEFPMNKYNKLIEIKNELSNLSNNKIENIYFQIYLKLKGNGRNNKWERIETGKNKKYSMYWSKKLKNWSSISKYVFRYKISYYPELWKQDFY